MWSGKALGKILRFELLWKLVFLFIINPLLRGAYHAYVSTAGLRFNGGVLWTFASLQGAVLFLALFCAAAWLVFYEYSVIIRVAALCRQGEDFTLGEAMGAALWDLGLLRGWSLAIGSLYYVLLLPMACVGYVSTIVPQVAIPWFIFGEMQKTPLGMAGIVAIYVVLYGVHLLLLFVPVLMTLEHRRFGQAAGESVRLWRRMGWPDRLAMLAVLALWYQLFTEAARYWRRNLLGNDDFDGNFFQYLLISEAFRKDLVCWALLTLVQTIAMAGVICFLAALLDKHGAGRAALQPAWSRDGAVLWEIFSRRRDAWAGRWRQRLARRRWRTGIPAMCLALAAVLLLSAERPLPVHRPFAIAHRGGEGGIENTLEALEAAARQGMDYGEIDVQLTADGVPVLFHDGSLTRMAGRGESVGELTWEELRQIPVTDYAHPGETARIPSLEETLAAMAGEDMGLLIELKPAAGGSEALADAVIALVERYDFGDRAMFMSLDYLCLMTVMERHPEWWAGFCAYGAAGDIDDAVWRYQVDFLAVEEALVSNRLVTRAREVDLPVYVWSVYDGEKMLQYLEMGVSGIITDYPEEIRRVLDGYLASHPGQPYQWTGAGAPGKE